MRIAAIYIVVIVNIKYLRHTIVRIFYNKLYYLATTYL